MAICSLAEASVSGVGKQPDDRGSDLSLDLLGIGSLVHTHDNAGKTEEPHLRNSGKTVSQKAAQWRHQSGGFIDAGMQAAE